MQLTIDQRKKLKMQAHSLKPVVSIGGKGLTDAVKKYSIPVLGIGGINLSNLTEISRSGASGFSAIGLFASFVGSDPKLLSDLVYRIKKNWG